MLCCRILTSTWQADQSLFRYLAMPFLRHHVYWWSPGHLPPPSHNSFRIWADRRDQDRKLYTVDWFVATNRPIEWRRLRICSDSSWCWFLSCQKPVIFQTPWSALFIAPQLWNRRPHNHISFTALWQAKLGNRVRCRILYCEFAVYCSSRYTTCFEYSAMNLLLIRHSPHTVIFPYRAGRASKEKLISTFTLLECPACPVENVG